MPCLEGVADFVPGRLHSGGNLESREEKKFWL